MVFRDVESWESTYSPPRKTALLIRVGSMARRSTAFGVIATRYGSSPTRSNQERSLCRDFGEQLPLSSRHMLQAEASTESGAHASSSELVVDLGCPILELPPSWGFTEMPASGSDMQAGKSES